MRLLSPFSTLLGLVLVACTAPGLCALPAHAAAPVPPALWEPFTSSATPLIAAPSATGSLKVQVFPFAQPQQVASALAQAPNFTPSSTLNYAMPASATAPASAGQLPTASAHSNPKKPGFWARLGQWFKHKPKRPKKQKHGVAMASINPNTPRWTLPSLWPEGQRPQPTAQEAQLMRFIKTTNPKWDEVGTHVLARWLLEASSQQGIDARILASIIAVESSFRPDAVSSSGAKGFGQLKDDTARWLGIDNAFDPLANVQGTAKYLRILGQTFPEDATKAIASYYLGQGTVQREGVNEAGWAYVQKVERYLQQWP